MNEIYDLYLVMDQDCNVAVGSTPEEATEAWIDIFGEKNIDELDIYQKTNMKVKVEKKIVITGKYTT